MKRPTPLELFHFLIRFRVKKRWATKIASRYLFSFLYRNNIHLKRIEQMILEEWPSTVVTDPGKRGS